MIVVGACGATACGAGPASFDEASPAEPALQPARALAPAGLAGNPTPSVQSERERLENGSYQLRPGSRQDLVATNHAQGLKLSVDSKGLHFSPQDSTKKGEVTLAYAGVGRAGEELASAELPAPELAGCEQDGRVDEAGECLKRIQFAHPGLLEWWENRVPGIEQGFTLAQRPAGEGSLLIGLDVKRGRIATLDESSAVIDGGAGFQLKYGQLSARDAKGDAVPISLRPGNGQLLLELDDSTATYPLAIDPIVSTKQWDVTGATGALLGGNVVPLGDVNGDGYGDFAVSASNATNSTNSALTGAGRVDVYYGSATGPSPYADLRIEGTQSNMHLGTSVAAAGDVNGDGFSDMIVGASGYANGQASEGYARIYIGGANGLVTTSTFWNVESNTANASFGAAVAGIGDINHDGYADVAVGAPFFTNNYLYEGRVTVYFGKAAGANMATNTADWTDYGGTASMHYGSAVSAAGDVNGDGYFDFAAGAPDYNGKGAVWVFKSNAAAQISTYQSVIGTVSNLRLGASLAFTDVNGDGYSDVIMGQPELTSPDIGQVQVKLGGPTNWSATTTLPGVEAGAGFGARVASLGDVNGDGYGDVGLASPYALGYSGTGEGKWAIYMGSEVGLQTSPNIWGYGSTTGIRCGAGLGTAGDVNGDGYSDVIVGCPSKYGTGEAFLYLGKPASISSAPGWSWAGGTTAWGVGDAIANADVNGDGFSDLIVTAPNTSSYQPGYLYVFNGAANGLSQTPATTIISPSTSASNQGHFGSAVANAGDINGDGYEDVIVSCPSCGIDYTGEGVVYVYFGAAPTLSQSSPWIFKGGALGAGLGVAVAGADVNGDGLSDIAISRPSYTNVEAGEGAVFVYLGNATATQPTAPVATLESNSVLASMGDSLASAGDVNGDGYGDLIVGSTDFNNIQGKVWVFQGKSTGINTTATWSYSPSWPGQNQPNFAESVASAGDVNGDGYDDVMVAAPRFSADQYLDGRTFVWLGSTTGLNSAVAWISQGTESYEEMGYAISGVGDLNGDGYGDVAVGSPWHNYDTLRGVFNDYLGGPGGLGQGSDSYSSSPSGFAGDHVGNAGDVNGDGFADMLVPDDSNNIYLFLGNTRDGAKPPPGAGAVARRPGLSTAIAPGGKPATRAFDVRLLARSPHGRTRAKIAVEAKPFGTYFDGKGLVKSTVWLDTTLTSVSITASLTGLTAAKRYHWRARVEYDRSLATEALWSHWYYGGVSGRALGNHLRMP